MLGSNGSRYGTYSGRLNSGRDTASIFEETIIMVFLMALAAAIRLWRLGEWSFWADEVFSMQDAQKIPNEFTINPIIYMMIRASTSAFGINEWSARLGPCIIGILSVPLLYLPARRMFSPKVAAIACLFLAIHPWHIYWSQNARAYSLAFLFSGLAAFTFYLALERDSLGFTFLSIFLTLLSIFSYPQSAVLLAALAGYVILLMFLPAGFPRGYNGKNLITFFAPFILSGLILLSPSVRSYLMEGWGVSQLGRGPLYLLFTLVYCLSVPMAVTSFVGGIHSLVYMNRSGLFLICYAVVPLIILLIISPFQNVFGYYVFFTMPAYLLLSAFCASALMDNTARRSRILSATAVLVVSVALCSQTYLYFTTENGGRPKWREAFQTVDQRMGAEDIVVVSFPRIAGYYFRKPGAPLLADAGSSSLENVIQLKDAIQQIGTLEDKWRRNGQSVWFVLDQESLITADANGGFREWVYSKCQLIKEFPVYARITDRTIRVWNAKYVKTDAGTGLPDVFDEGTLP